MNDLNTSWHTLYIFLKSNSLFYVKGGKDDKKDDKKGGKKKKEPEVELKRMPPTYTTLATWHIPLIDFLEGEYEFRSVFTQGGVEVASTIKSLDIGKVSLYL